MNTKPVLSTCAPTSHPPAQIPMGPGVLASVPLLGLRSVSLSDSPAPCTVPTLGPNPRRSCHPCLDHLHCSLPCHRAVEVRPRLRGATPRAGSDGSTAACPQQNKDSSQCADPVHSPAMGGVPLGSPAGWGRMLLSNVCWQVWMRCRVANSWSLREPARVLPTLGCLHPRLAPGAPGPHRLG